MLKKNKKRADELIVSRMIEQEIDINIIVSYLEQFDSNSEVFTSGLTGWDAELLWEEGKTFISSSGNVLRSSECYLVSNGFITTFTDKQGSCTRAEDILVVLEGQKRAYRTATGTILRRVK